MRPAHQTRSYTDIHKQKIEERQAAGMSDVLERDIMLCIDRASGEGQYSCIYKAMNPEQAETIQKFMNKHGYNATIMGSDIQISW